MKPSQSIATPVAAGRAFLGLIEDENYNNWRVYSASSSGGCYVLFSEPDNAAIILNHTDLCRNHLFEDAEVPARFYQLDGITVYFDQWNSRYLARLIRQWTEWCDFGQAPCPISNSEDNELAELRKHLWELEAAAEAMRSEISFLASKVDDVAAPTLAGFS